MSDGILVEIVKIAAAISNPLSLAGLGLSLFFGLAYSFVRRASVDEISARALPKLVIIIVSYGFILSLVALILGVTAWLFSSFIGPTLTARQIDSAVGREDYSLAIRIGSDYIKRNPEDDTSRHNVGTSFYATERFEEGYKLYKDMDAIYSDLDPCSDKRSSSLSSLAVFAASTDRVEEALELSSKTWGCENDTEAYVFNHLLLLALNGRAPVHPTNPDFEFQSSFFQARHNLLKFTFQVKEDHVRALSDYTTLAEAYCEDEFVKKVIQGRFENGDVSSSSLRFDNFDYEMKTILNSLSPDQRSKLLLEISERDCVL